MKLTMAEIMLLIDTLGGSLSFANDTRRIFKYTDEDREKMFNKLFIYMNSILVDVKIDENTLK